MRPAAALSKQAQPRPKTPLGRFRAIDFVSFPAWRTPCPRRPFSAGRENSLMLSHNG
jgi:hypothetical protein